MKNIMCGIKLVFVFTAGLFVWSLISLNGSMQISSVKEFFTGLILFSTSIILLVLGIRYNYRLKACIDPQTNTYSTIKFKADIKEIDRVRTKTHLYLCDIDGLKRVNDTYGHNIGDLLIKSLAFGLRELCSKHRNMRVYRMYTRGDEFAITIKDDECQTREMENELQELLDNLTLSFEAAGRTEKIVTQASYGKAICYGEEGYTTDKALEIADSRMYEQKHKRKEGKR